MTDNEPVYEGLDTPWRRNPEELKGRLTEWAQTTFGANSIVANVVAPDNGMSSESALFDVTIDGVTTGYVARMAPLPNVIPVFETYDIELQAKAMNLVSEKTNVPVPEVPFVVLDESILDVPFLVMKKLPGSAPSDVPPYVFGGWVCDMTPEQRNEMERNAVKTLVDLHTITVDNADLSFLMRPDKGTTALEQHLGHERHYYEWARGDVRYSLIEQTFAWLDENLPTLSGPTVLNWGDARLGNMMWDGPKPTAVLDWEMASVGPAGVDIAWMIFLHKFFQNMAETYGFPGLPDFMQRENVKALYEEMSGQKVEALEWFEVFAALRFATISVRTSSRSIAYGQAEQPEDPNDLIMFRPLLEKMLDGSYWS